MTPERTTEQAIDRAATAFANVLATCAQMTPREQAEAAWSPTSPYTVDELEDRIRSRRGMGPAKAIGLDDPIPHGGPVSEGGHTVACCAQ